MSRSLALLARASARHPWRTILVWVVVLLAVSANAGKLDGEFVDDFRLPNSEAQQAADRLEESFPAQSGASATVVLAVEDGTLSAEANAAAIEATLAEVGELDHVVSVSDPLAAGSISSTEEIAFAEVRYDRDVVDLDKDDFDALESTVGALRDRGVQAEVGGPLAWCSRSAWPCSRSRSARRSSSSSRRRPTSRLRRRRWPR
jgi:RND superfamily putative drug exporter